MSAPPETRRLRLAIVCRSCGEGGSVANVALRQARELASGWDVTLISESFPERLPSGVKTTALRTRSFAALRRFGHVPRELSFCFAATRALRRMNRCGLLDLVLFHSHAAAMAAIPRLRGNSQLRFAMVTHGDVFERPAGTYDRRLTAFYRAVTPRAYAACDLVIALSPDMAMWAQRGGVPNPARIAVIANGVDVTDLGFPADGEPEPPPPGPPLRILYVGRLAAEKGVGVLLHALRALRAEGVDVRATVVGDGAEARAHAAFVTESGLGDMVELAGSVARSRLSPLFGSHQVVCVPSLSDPLPTVVLEALALGRPVVGSHVGGIPFLVADRVNGLLFPPGDASALAERLRELAASPGLVRSLAVNARPSVLPRLSWEQVGRRLGSELHDLAACGSNGFPLTVPITRDRSAAR